MSASHEEPRPTIARRSVLKGSAAVGLVLAAQSARAQTAPQIGPAQLLTVASYEPTDRFFGKPIVTSDTLRTLPSPHRRILGGFEGTDTRFAFYYPTTPTYRGRFIQFLQGGLGGTEPGGLVPDVRDPTDVYSTLGAPLSLAESVGGYLVETNQGHIGSALCRKAGRDASIYGHRASAESARFGRHLAAEIYGKAPHHGYVYGGSGGARRSVNCIENVSDVWAGAMPFMGGGPVAPAGAYDPTIAADFTSHAFGALFNVQRVLKDKLALVVEALEPGGGGDPFAGLNLEQREALAELYRLGFPRGQEFMIAYPAGQIGNWAWNAETLKREDPGYWTAFWNEPGYLGHDAPERLAGDLIDTEVVVKRVVTAREMAARVAAGGPEAQSPMALRARLSPPDTPVAIEVGPQKGYLLGASLKILSGKAAGRQIWCVSAPGEVLFSDGIGEAGNLRFQGVAAGDRIKLDNRDFLAFCYFHRHHVQPGMTDLVAAATVGGVPIYPQRKATHRKESQMGPNFTARPQGKVLFVQHTHDSSIWPGVAIRYAEDVRRVVGAGADEVIQLRWVQHAEHGGPPVMPMRPAASTRLINASGHIEQNLHDLIAWTEDGKRPAVDNYRYEGGKFTLPATAGERGGVQPMVRAQANGQASVAAKPGQAVTFTVEAETPAGAGTVVRVEWDFEGDGTFPQVDPGIDGRQASVRRTTSYAFAKPGVYFPAVRVTSHRDGDVKARLRRVNNIARVRVVVA